MRPMGKNQKDVLRALHRHGGTWRRGCGWVWDTPSGTERLLDGLVRRGLAVRETLTPHRGTNAARVSYRITVAGCDEAERAFPHHSRAQERNRARANAAKNDTERE